VVIEEVALGKRRIKRKKKPSGLGQGGMLQQLQSLQDDMLKAQDELTEMVVTATVGGGAVTATVTGERRVESLTIEPEVVDPEDVEMLQDLVIAAVNEGLEQIDRITSERMAAFTGGFDIPGLT
jgi:DNA-binding YbaB/EbfC family protein